MKNFAYYKPATLKDAARLLTTQTGKNLPWAGGTDILGMMKDGLAAPDGVVDLKSLPGLDKIEYRPGQGLLIGAMTTLARIAVFPEIVRFYPVLAQAAGEAASPQLRNQGTLGGNLCQRPRCWYFRGETLCLRKGGDDCFAVEGRNKYHCIIGGAPCFIVHPSDSAIALTALNAVLHIAEGMKVRRLAISDFFVLPEKNVTRENILKPGEIITAIEVPDVNPRTRSIFLKVKERGSWDFATVSVAVIVEREASGFRSGRIALGGVAPVPWLEHEVSKALSGFNPTPEAISRIAALILKNAEPMTENAYKITMTRNLVQRALSELAG